MGRTGKASELTTAPSLTLNVLSSAFRQLDVVMAYLPSGLRTMFRGMSPTGPLVVPAGVICRPFARMREADGAGCPDSGPHPAGKAADKPTSAMITIVT